MEAGHWASRCNSVTTVWLAEKPNPSGSVSDAAVTSVRDANSSRRRNVEAMRSLWCRVSVVADVVGLSLVSLSLTPAGPGQRYTHLTCFSRTLSGVFSPRGVQCSRRFPDAFTVSPGLRTNFYLTSKREEIILNYTTAKPGMHSRRYGF